MTRAVWKGYVSLGQLGIPVRLYGATKSMRPHFFQLHETDGSPVERQLRCKAEGKEIASSEVIKAVELERGKFLALTDQELEITASDMPKSIAIQQFGQLEMIPPEYFEKAFYIVPGRGGERAYALLREVLGRMKRVAVARFSIYGSEHLAAIRGTGNLLMLHQLHFAAEVLPPTSLTSPPLPRPTPKEIDALSAVVERLSGALYLEDYHDDYADHLEALVERKAKGITAKSVARPEPHATPDSELMATLETILQKGNRLAAHS